MEVGKLVFENNCKNDGNGGNLRCFICAVLN
jgi:hypothetical protein